MNLLAPAQGTHEDAVKAIRLMRERDCDFLTVENVQDYANVDGKTALHALAFVMGRDWVIKMRGGELGPQLALDLGWDWIPGQMAVQAPDGRLFAVVKGRRWTRVHEYLSNGQLTARWFVDEKTGETREAEGARKPRAWRMGGEAAAFVRWIVELAHDPTGGV